MMRSTGGEQTLEAFEGLVLSTARMFAAQVKREEDDLAQELRVRVWKAVIGYNPAKTTLSLERYVFQAITNKIKDYKRDAAREAKRREREGVSFLYIEDMFLLTDRTTGPQERFDSLYHFVEHEDVYGDVDGRFVMPSSVTESEANVLLLLMTGLSKTEVAVRLGITRADVFDTIGSLRAKFADWQPANSSRVVSRPLAAAAA
jgi:RNA polymerase sigma factor (sigma-70 family)